MTERKYVSETGRHREIIIQKMEDYFEELDCLNGVDIGFGGDPILQNSITMDLPIKYSKNIIQTSPQNLFGDCKNMYWFADNSLDYVYSAHVLEDYLETEEIMTEWIRIIKPNGLLILDLPNERQYRKVCEERGYRSNPRHQIIEMSPKYIIPFAEKLGLECLNVVEELPPDYYSFLMVFKKC